MRYIINILDNEEPRHLNRGEWGHVESLDYFSVAKFDDAEKTSGKYTPCKVAELRCDKCTYWRRLDYRCSVKPGAWSPDEFCSLWEAK
jgi:hypothetical protein